MPTASVDPVKSPDASGAHTPTHRATPRAVTMNSSPRQLVAQRPPRAGRRPRRRGARRGGTCGATLRTLLGGRPGDGHGQARIVHLRVVVLQGTDERVAREGSGNARAPCASDMPVTGQRAGARRAGRRPAGRRRCRRRSQHAMMQRQHERQRLDQVRGQGREQQVALAQGLTHQRDIALLQVAQSAVDQLARAARRAARRCRPCR